MLEFNFTNFIPRKQFAHFANFHLARIAEKAPSDSYSLAHVTRKTDSFEFYIKFVSQSNTFESTYNAKIPKLPGSRSWQQIAIERMVEDLNKQIELWRAHRKLAS